jgi:hypothetical protein
MVPQILILLFGESKYKVIWGEERGTGYFSGRVRGKKTEIFYFSRVE